MSEVCLGAAKAVLTIVTWNEVNFGRSRPELWTESARLRC